MSIVVIRSFIPETDSGIIFGTWPKGKYYKDIDEITLTKKEWFRGFYDHVKAKIADSEILIATLTDDPNFIIGYCIISGGRLEWIFVKRGYRKQGIAKLLMKGKEELWNK